MNIGKRLMALRTAKDLSQGDIEKRTGLLRSYVSRVENGHTIPNTETLERWAKALGLELYQLFFEGDGRPKPATTGSAEGLDRMERQLVALYRQVNDVDKRLLLHVARQMAKRRA